MWTGPVDRAIDDTEDISDIVKRDLTVALSAKVFWRMSIVMGVQVSTYMLVANEIDRTFYGAP